MTLPHHDRTGRVVAKQRYFPNGDRRWRRGDTPIPFGLERLPKEWSKRRESMLIWAEGGTDALALLDAVAELDGRAVFALGCPGASSWRSEWAAYANGFGAVYVAGDGDPSGQAFNDQVGRDLHDLRIIPLPDGEDVRSVLQRPGGIEESHRLVMLADHRFRETGVELLHKPESFRDVAPQWLRGSS